MLKDRILVVGFLGALGAGGAVSLAGAAWMRSLAPLQSVAGAMETPDQAIQPIREGRQDLRDFFASLGFTGEFELVTALRDEPLGRRYYQARLNAGSRNIPHWWSAKTPPDADQIMLAHGGNPNWYVVLERDGAVCLMWLGR
jgi:hypothetical protein